MLRFPRAIDALPAIFEGTERWCAQHGIEKALRLKLDFVIEELFTNLVKYGAGTAAVGLTLRSIDDGVQAVIDDPDGQPFNPGEAAPVDTSAPLERRHPGGLGLHLVRRLATDVDVQRNPSGLGSRIRVSVRHPASPGAGQNPQEE
jgi:anti-sigma regulatory factor (Ser/Thr protein kinase)